MEVYMLIKSLPEDERPQEKALKNGVSALSDAELIALILRTGRHNASSLALAEEVLSICDEGLFSMGTFEAEDLLKIEGIGPGKASTLMAAVELGKRIAASRKTEKYVADGLEFETVPAYNIGKPFHPQSACWVGYIINLNGKRVYISGDTDATPEAEKVKCDVAFVPVGGTYTMNALQAAELVNRIKPGIAVPVHYGEIVGSKKDGLKFADAVDKSIKVDIKIPF